jgi:hypothetical protein
VPRSEPCTHPIDACIDEADGFLKEAESELDNRASDDALWNLVQASKWLQAGLEALSFVGTRRQQLPLRAAAAWVIEHVPSMHRPLAALMRVQRTREQARDRRRVLKTRRDDDDIPYGRRHFWDLWADPQCCLYCDTPRTLDSESTICSTTKLSYSIEQDLTLS